MSRRVPAPVRATLIALCAVVLLGAGTPEASAGSAVRPYKEGGAIRLDTDLVSVSGLSAWAIDQYLESNTPLPRLGAAFLAAERRYGVNAKFLLAAALHESNWGRSGLSRAKHNLFGYNAYDRDPFKYATAFDGYAAGIDGVARFMKEAYLTRSGRWWGGAPTLRSMQRFWSSSGAWGINVSRIATSLKLDSLRKRKVRFEAPVLPEVIGTGEALTLALDWRGGRMPGAITYRVTWTQVAGQAAPATAEADTAVAGAPDHTNDAVAVQSSDPGVLGGRTGTRSPGLRVPAPATPVPPTLEPLTQKATRTGLGRSSARLRVVAPPEPGEYVLAVTLRDRDGKVLPRADKVSIPTVRVQVSGDWAVRYDVEHLAGGRLRVTATNVGKAAIPVNPLPESLADRLGSNAVRETVLALRAYDRGHPDGVEVARLPLASPLARGASVAILVSDRGALVPDTEAYIVPELLVHDDPERLAGSRPAGFWLRADGSEQPS